MSLVPFHENAECVNFNTYNNSNEHLSRNCQVLGGIYAGNISGVTAQHLEWVIV